LIGLGAGAVGYDYAASGGNRREVLGDKYLCDGLNNEVVDGLKISVIKDLLTADGLDCRSVDCAGGWGKNTKYRYDGNDKR
jgi:hypothetical protein